jgi:hypothetical protein
VIVLSPQQETKFRRLKAQERSIHALLLTFRERRAALVAQLTHLDGQVASERSRGKSIPPTMSDEIASMKAPIEAELAALANEESSVTGQWRQAAQLVQALDKFVQGARRSN